MNAQFTLRSVRPAILKQFYECTYGGKTATAQAFSAATFDEYYALSRTVFPKMSRYRAAVRAPKEEWRKLAEKLPADPSEEDTPPEPSTHLARLALLDLEGLNLDTDVTEVALDRIKRISGWTALRKLHSLARLYVTLSGAAKGEELSPPLTLKRLSINECDATCLFMLLAGTRAEEIDVMQTAFPILDLSALKAHSKLTNLRLSAPIIRDLSCLKKLPIVRLLLAQIVPDQEFIEMICSISDTLQELRLETTRPFLPAALASLPHVTRIQVTGFPEVETDWIDYAVAHPDIAFRFDAVPLPNDNAKVFTLEEIYRGIDILRVVRGSRVEFEVATDMVDEMVNFEGDNGDLESYIKQLAKKSKVSVKWSSEANTLIARATTIAAIKWVIDTALNWRGNCS